MRETMGRMDGINYVPARSSEKTRRSSGTERRHWHQTAHDGMKEIAAPKAHALNGIKHSFLFPSPEPFRCRTHGTNCVPHLHDFREASTTKSRAQGRRFAIVKIVDRKRHQADENYTRTEPDPIKCTRLDHKIAK